jgi:hypothetical protein
LEAEQSTLRGVASR